ncbi:lipopolysaccharide biosynthesis protein [Massilia endophytica]|uniref:lipopolysaccharide biosynthesis protein n=1 Tax=Massilia endophytica TaxID=2899220 RepID=UPI001E54539C|nr:lipopolysaccharide biosynthesis protein [Massilia endophytica]UGQ47642.1 lipopolysaccharide biosynthesis protein [Massilia endophytica]
MSDLRRIAGMSMAKGYGVLLSLAMLFVSARLLGPEGRGEFAAATAWAALFATLCNLSLGQALQHRLQAAAAKPSLGEQLGTLGGMAGLLSALALGLAAALYLGSGGALFKGIGPLSMVLALATVPLLVWEQYSGNIGAAASQTGLLNRAQYIGRTVGFAAFFLLVMALGWGVAGALSAQLIGQLLVGLLVAWPLFKLAGGSLNWLQREVKPLLRSGLAIHLTTVSAFLLDQVSLLLINHHLSKPEVGWYQLAQQMVALMLIVPQSALMIVYGGLANSTPDAYWPRQRRLNWRLLGGLAGLAVAAWLLAPLVVPLVAGQAFAPSVPLFRMLLPTVLGISLALLMTPQWIGRGLLRLNMALTCVTGAAVVAASFWAIPHYGLDGAVWVRLGVYAVWVPLAQIVFWLWCNRQAAKE